MERLLDIQQRYWDFKTAARHLIRTASYLYFKTRGDQAFEVVAPTYVGWISVENSFLLVNFSLIFCISSVAFFFSWCGCVGVTMQEWMKDRVLFYFIIYVIFLYVFIQTAKYFVSVCFKKIVKWEYIQLQDEVVSGEVTGWYWILLHILPADRGKKTLLD